MKTTSTKETRDRDFEIHKAWALALFQKGIITVGEEIAIWEAYESWALERK